MGYRPPLITGCRSGAVPRNPRYRANRQWRWLAYHACLARSFVRLVLVASINSDPQILVLTHIITSIRRTGPLVVSVGWMRPLSGCRRLVSPPRGRGDHGHGAVSRRWGPAIAPFEGAREPGDWR